MPNIQNSKIVKYEYIDILRGVAILGVIAVHSSHYIRNLDPYTTSIFSYGQIGVQMFFLASAMTLCLSMTRRKEATVLKFYIRRLFRIAPLYYFGILLYFLWRPTRFYILNGWVKFEEAYSLRAIFENIFFVHGFDWENFNYVVPGGWSIATEMSFYLIFPLLFLVQSRLGFRKLFQLSLALFTVCFALQYVLVEYAEPALFNQGTISTQKGNDNFGFIYATLINQLPVFLIGILTFRLLGKKMPAGGLPIALILILASIYIQSDFVYKTGFNGFFFPLLSAIAFGIIALKLSAKARFESMVARALIQIGKHSYSMYVLHFFLIEVLVILYRGSLFNVTTTPIVQLLLLLISAIMIAHILARITNRYIEKPGITAGKRFT